MRRIITIINPPLDGFSYDIGYIKTGYLPFIQEKRRKYGNFNNS